MPAIRDATVAYETVTTDAGLTIPMCGYAANDLLFAFCVGDTGAPTWGCSNGVGTWTQLFARNNTCSSVVYWKYAAASGEGDVVFTSTVNETYSGAVVSIRDVFQGYTGGSPPVQANSNQAASTRFSMDGITTSAPDSLVLCFVSSSGTAPSLHFVEGLLQELVKVDGAAEGLGLGWFFQKAAGATPTINANAMVGAVGTKATIEVRAPAGGATIIPAHTAAEDSIYLTPSFGIAFDGNTVLAATADTNFGTSIAGYTANDGTVAAAVADIGLDVGSYMSFAGLTNLASATAISGAEGVVAAARYNVGNRNILTHWRHSTPVQNQRLSPLGSGRGVWFGMRSGTTAGTNWKVWQVHGADVEHPNGLTRPVVVNAANTDTIAVAGTLSNSDVRAYGVWTSGLGALTQQAAFGPTWAMDTTTVCGGNSTEPIDVPALVSCIANRKNRLSAILQGANQMLLLQKVQIGNGGTNPTYFKINTAAVEFPSQKNFSKKLVNYNGIDNAIGLVFYPGASDTIDVASSVFASASRYEFSLHASASTSATYNFNGAAVIGAGTVSLARAITISNLTVDNYSTLDLSSATFSAGSISTVPSTNDSLTTNGSTSITGCEINVSAVSSGNRWCSVASPVIFSNNAFTGGGGHAIRITSPGTYNFVGNTFTGFGADGSNGAAIFNDSGGAVTLNISGSGTTPTVRNGTSASTTVNNTITLTLTGLVANSDIVILDAGTTTERVNVDSNPTTSYAFNYTALGNVDVCVYKAGYVPFIIRTYALGATSASLPISQVADRNYVP